MTTQENIVYGLKTLFDVQLPAILRELSIEYNDGLELKELTDTLIFGGSARVPYSVISIKNGEYSEKDRIIENVVFDVTIDFYLADCKDKWRYECRYTEAAKRFVEANRENLTAWDWLYLRRTEGSKVLLTVVG